MLASDSREAAVRSDTLDSVLDAAGDDALRYAADYRRTIGDPIDDLATIIQVDASEVHLLLDDFDVLTNR